MQHRGAFVERDDVAVRQFLVALPHGRAVRQVSLELGCAGCEGLACGHVPADGHVGRPAHAFELVRGLYRAVVMQLVQQRCGVDRGEAPVGERRLPFADERDAATGKAEQFTGLRRVAQDFQAEFTQPVTARQRWRPVPVVGRLVKAQQRRRSRRVAHEALLHVGERDPLRKMRVHAERVAAVVQEGAAGGAREDSDAVESVCGQRQVHAAAQLGQVGGKQLVDIHVHGRWFPW